MAVGNTIVNNYIDFEFVLVLFLMEEGLVNEIRNVKALKVMKLTKQKQMTS